MKNIIVIKVGTGVLTTTDGQLKTEPFYSLANQAALLKHEGYGVIIVSSGGVAAGSERVSCLGGEPSLYCKSDLAGIGSRHLLNRWGDAFALHHLDVAQFWMTYGNLAHKSESKSIRSKLRVFASDSRIVPIVNENDVVSAVEIEKMRRGLGDNDHLARSIARLVKASHILFVTEAGGVYTHNPALHSEAELVCVIDARKRFRLPRKGSGPARNGTGGMQSKVNQARICARRGINAYILGFKDVLPCIRGEPVGTFVSA
mgnify:FL=1